VVFGAVVTLGADIVLNVGSTIVAVAGCIDAGFSA